MNHNYYGEKYKFEYYDKNMIPIREGDILKVYHYTDRRKKKHFMYKLVINKNGYLLGCHLEFENGKTNFFGGYDLRSSSKIKDSDIYVLFDSEIVQGFNGGYFSERTKLTRLLNSGQSQAENKN